MRAVSFYIFASIVIKSFATFNSTNLTIPFIYPLFKQCDPAWGDDLMGSKTICSVGCLMSSTAMGLSGTNIPIKYKPEVTSTPKTLNVWLQNHDGYQDNNLVESQVPLIDPSRISWPDDAFHKTNDLSYSEVVSYLDKGRVVIANVNNGGHFVLVTGYSLEDMDTFAVNDPGYTRDTYSYKSDVVGYRIFDMQRK
eukprot:gene9444-12725_t